MIIKIIFRPALIAAILASMVSISGARENFITGSEIKELENSGVIISIGKNQWKTRGGLIIKGKDPENLTRLEHIMKHARDMDGRAKHGVFSISKTEIIKLMDTLWAKIRSGAIKGNARGGKVEYTWNTGKTIGYLGGREGRDKKHPPLTSVRMVLNEKTPQVITFFPY